MRLNSARPTTSEKKLLVSKLRLRKVAEESCSTIGTKLLMQKSAKL